MKRILLVSMLALTGFAVSACAGDKPGANTPAAAANPCAAKNPCGGAAPAANPCGGAAPATAPQ